MANICLELCSWKHGTFPTPAAAIKTAASRWHTRVGFHLWQCSAYLVAGLMYLGVLLHTPLKLPMACWGCVFPEGQAMWIPIETLQQNLYGAPTANVCFHTHVLTGHLLRRKESEMSDVHLFNGHWNAICTLIYGGGAFTWVPHWYILQLSIIYHYECKFRASCTFFHFAQLLLWER